MSKLWETATGEKGPGTPGDAGKKIEAFTVDNDYQLDQVLLPYDLKGSGVHVKALQKAGVLSNEEAQTLLNGLEEVLKLWQAGQFEIRPEHEDGHTAIELWLTGQMGDLGKKIHTGRSRNDQVLTAMRLYEKERLDEILARAAALTGTLLDLARAHETLPMPGYTHTRKAMLSSTGQWLGGYGELLVMQLEASGGVRSLIGRSPLGTAAGFGTTIDLDREMEAELLGFDQPVVCATAAQLSRGWVELQLVQYLAGFTSVLARLAGDVVLFSSQHYGYIGIDPALCTGSSIMPNKENPDVAELVRGKHSRMVGYAASLQAVTANLGSGYHRDLQLTKEPVLLAIETADEVIEVAQLLLEGLSFNKKALEDACSSELMAAEEAYKLVRQEGMSFRDAYRQVKNRSQESGSAMSPAGLLAEYSQLGSPGNPGLERLGKQLKKVAGSISQK